MLGKKYEYLGLSERVILLAKKGEIQEALNLIEVEDPVWYVKHGSNLIKRLQEIYFTGLGMIPKYPFDSFTLPDDLIELMNLFEESIKVQKQKTLCIIGPSGSGKTEFMLAYFVEKLGLKTLVITNIDSLKKFSFNDY